MALPTFAAAFMRTNEQHTILPVTKPLAPVDATLPIGLKVTVISEDGVQAVVRFLFKKQLYQAVVSQDSLMVDYRMLGMEV